MELTILFIWNCFMSETSLLFVFLFSIVINIQLFVVYSSQNCFFQRIQFCLLRCLYNNILFLLQSCFNIYNIVNCSTYTALFSKRSGGIFKKLQGFSGFSGFCSFACNSKFLHASQGFWGFWGIFICMQVRDFGDFRHFHFACKPGILRDFRDFHFTCKLGILWISQK